MYNQTSQIIFTDRQFAWLCMLKEQPGVGGWGVKERKEKEKAESTMASGSGATVPLISLVVSQKWRKMSLIYLAY